MYWLTESSFQPMMWGILLTFVTGAAWFMLRKKALLFLAILIICLTIGVVITERIIVTDREQLTEDLYAVVRAVQTNNKDLVLSFISHNSQPLIDEINRDMPSIDFQSVVVSKIDITNVDSEGNPPTAVLEFNARVRADARSSRFGGMGTGLARVTLNYEKTTSGKWKIAKYKHDPIRVNDFM